MTAQAWSGFFVSLPWVWMNTTIILVIIIVFSFVASRLLKRYVPAYFAFSGAEYLALGIVLGPLVTSFVQKETLQHLEPVISLLLGLVGFTLGLRLREHVSEVKSLGPRVIASAIAIAVPAVGCAAFLTLAPVEPLAREQVLILSGTVGVMACVSSSTRIEAVARLLSASGWVTRNLLAFSIVSDTIAVFCFGIIASVLRSRAVGGVLGGFDPLTWLGASAGVGVICGLLFIAFIGRVRSTPHVFLATLGCVIFASGVATALGLSPLFINLIVGATLALLSKHAEILRGVVQRLDHPTLILLLIFAGIVWKPIEQPWMWVFVPLYMILRFVGLRTGTALMVPLIKGSGRVRRFGNGLLSQGVIAVAIAVDFTRLSPENASFALTTLLLAMLAQDFMATRSLRRVLADAEELYTDMVLPERGAGPDGLGEGSPTWAELADGAGEGR